MKEHIIATELCAITLYLLSTVKGIQGAKLLDSLQCYNDFRSYTNCTWTESGRSRLFVNMSLYLLDKHQVQNLSEFLMVPCQQTKTLSGIMWSCSYRIGSFFNGRKDIYTFIPDKDLKSQILINFTNKDTMEKKETKPIIYVSEEEYFLRWAEVPDNLTTPEVSQCEVNYKQESKSWEDSYPGLCQSSWGIISRDKLLPEVKYIARMRVKPWSNDENWSTWSTEALLPLRSKVHAAEEAKPQNLRCANLTCMWETRLEVTDSVVFSLYYKQNQMDKELECEPSCQEEVPSVPYISCHCYIPAEGFNLQMVTVKPKQENKTIQPCSNIRVPPRHLKVEEKDQGESFLAKWDTEEINNVPWIYQVCYGIDNSTSTQMPVDCEQIPKEQPDTQRLLVLHQDLTPSTRYYMKVRMRVNQHKPNTCYSGVWSEWSNIQRWETKSVVDLRLLYLMIPVCFIILIICSVYATKILKRSTKQWEDRIPDPGKSTFIGDFLQKRSHLNRQCPEYYMYEELIDICSPVSLEMVNKGLSSSERNLDDRSTPGMAPMDDNDSHGIFQMIVQDEDVEGPVVVSAYKLFTDVAHDLPNEDLMDNQFQDISFNGPYITCPSDRYKMSSADHDEGLNS
ncbi:cytokine receptor common subunit beta-like [Discoglossus pictus]